MGEWLGARGLEGYHGIKSCSTHSCGVISCHILRKTLCMDIEELIENVASSNWIQDIKNFERVFPQYNGGEIAVEDFRKLIPELLLSAFMNDSMEDIVLEWADSLFDIGLAEELCSCSMEMDGMSPYSESFTLCVTNSNACYYYYVLENTVNGAFGHKSIAESTFYTVGATSHKEIVEEFKSACESYFESSLDSSGFDEDETENYTIKFYDSFEGVEFADGFNSVQA